ncbi:uncharacterized protein TrAFT101_011909 [Trichoderma asperellum]|uniref:uncharacterized protein n=1 Tax=Trichoderma asperellum TaxID=101201 RepID=UPI00332EAB68|nr:hypothetical protein TrAFT101_011909 [Trichoderma asperellum]
MATSRDVSDDPATATEKRIVSVRNSVTVDRWLIIADQPRGSPNTFGHSYDLKCDTNFREFDAATRFAILDMPPSVLGCLTS